MEMRLKYSGEGITLKFNNSLPCAHFGRDAVLEFASPLWERGEQLDGVLPSNNLLGDIKVMMCQAAHFFASLDMGEEMTAFFRLENIQGWQLPTSDSPFQRDWSEAYEAGQHLDMGPLLH